MIRIIFLGIAILLIIWKLHRINKKVLCAKSYIFIKETKNKVPLDEANYKANLFDFFKHKEAKAVFAQMKNALEKDYSRNMNKMIFRAETWGFVDTHTRDLFKKRKKVMLLIEECLLTLNPASFSGNATEMSKNLTLKHWDTNALLMKRLDKRVCALKILLDEYKETKGSLYPSIAVEIATDIQNDAKHLDKEDINIVSEWKDIIRKNKK
ncbi:MAG: hypothetical protein LBR70_00225 [Lactobacillaceae bacterium]|nr:hypothetical protein [Lactobacillaceae bacterium]